MTAELDASELDALRDVGYIYDDLTRPVAVRLTFEVSTLFIVAEADADTVAVSAVRPAGRDVSVSTRQPWAGAIGRHVLWMWKLTNQTGYTDGVQVLLTKPPAADVCVQLMVVASQLEVHEVREIERALYEDDRPPDL